MKLFNYINRIRTTFGFGVHSAFAYYFIMNVLREKNAYYVYDLIDSIPVSTKTARMLFRVKLFFNATPFHIISSNNSSLEKIIYIAEKESGTGLQIKYIDNTEIVFLQLQKKTANDIILQQQLKNMTYGMTFINPNKHAIIVKDPNLPRKDYELFF